MLSVLQVTPELNAGGVERTTLEIAEAISRAGGLALVASAGGRLEPDLEAAGGELIKLPLKTKNPITALANAFALADIVRKRGVDIIHARSRAPAWSAYLAARMTGAHFVTTYHGIYNARSAPKRLYNSVMARGEVVIANSEYTRTHILERYPIAPERVVTIPRGVDLDVFDRACVPPEEIAALREAWGLREGDKRCVFIAPARLTRWKGQLELVGAVELIESRRPGAVRVILAGDPQGRAGYVSEIVTKIEGGSLQHVVAAVGHVRHMPAAFAVSDVAVFPVIEPEAFGRGAVEAQAMGVPAIASSLGGYGETIIDGDTGALVEPRDVAALAAAMERMIDIGGEGRTQMGARGQARARTMYAKSALQSATLAVYQRLLRKRKEQQTGQTGHEAVL